MNWMDSPGSSSADPAADHRHDMENRGEQAAGDDHQEPCFGGPVGDGLSGEEAAQGRAAVEGQ